MADQRTVAARGFIAAVLLAMLLPDNWNPLHWHLLEWAYFTAAFFVAWVIRSDLQRR
jgi:hypothetical protein